MLATLTLWPALTATPLRVSAPAPNSVVIVTACSVFGGLSLRSVKPKSAAVKTCGVSSLMVIVVLVPTGASFTGVMLVDSVTVALLNGVVPPRTDMLTSAPLVTVVELSIRRTVRVVGVPL